MIFRSARGPILWGEMIMIDRLGRDSRFKINPARTVSPPGGRGEPVSLAEIEAMSPLDMAGRSGPVMRSWDFLLSAAESIQDRWLRDKVMGLLFDPSPTFLDDRISDSKKTLYLEMVRDGLIDPAALPADDFPPPDFPASDQSFLAAPGGDDQAHHCYPGGLVAHTAWNLRVSLGTYDGYRNLYDGRLDGDAIIAAQVLHDLHKPWILQWQADGSIRSENRLAGTGEHHCYSLAESIHGGLPLQIIVAQAWAHNKSGWTGEEPDPARWLKAGAILAGVDPVKVGLLDSSDALSGPPTAEAFVCHLGDHDWVLAKPATRRVNALLEQIAASEYGLTREELTGRRFRAFRNYIFSQATIMALYQLFAARGRAALADRVRTLVIPD